MSTVHIIPPVGDITATIVLPSSKSISNRALILRSLFAPECRVDNLSEADDTRLMQQALQQAGGKIMLGNAGTCMRFLVAYFAARPGDVELTGDDRMNRRPIGPLVDALRILGANIEYSGEEGFPPLKIRGKMLEGGEVEVDAGMSSQFVSALMLIGPSFRKGVRIRIRQGVRSLSYIRMTAGMMNAFGLKAELSGDMINIPPCPESIDAPGTFSIEPDWSSASYWYEIAALSPGSELLLSGLQETSLQGDSAIVRFAAKLGVKTTFTPKGALLTKHQQEAAATMDLSDTPDLAPAIAAMAAGLNAGATLTGLGNLPFKESDRLSALETEMQKAGFNVRAKNDSLVIAPARAFPPTPPQHTFETYSDHRMVMSIAPLSIVLGPIDAGDPDAVVKSYPGFWKDMERAGFSISRAT